MEYTPDRWVIVKYTHPKRKPEYKVLGGWSGGYTTGDSWRMNSGITSMKETETAYEFTGYSGSVYVCRKGGYGMNMIMSSILKNFESDLAKADKTIKQTVLSEDTDFTKIAWRT